MTPSSNFEVITVGETMSMLTPAVPEPLESARTFHLASGGAESNVALYLDELGHSTTWVSRLGNDPMGRRVLADITAHGVDTSYVTIDPHASTGLYIKDPGVGSSTVYYYRKESAASRMGPEIVKDLPIQCAQLLHLTGITPGLSETCAALSDALFTAASRVGAKVSFDVNFRPGIWPITTAAHVLKEQANRANIVFVGLDEAQALWGTASPEDVRATLTVPSTLVVKNAGIGATEFHRELNGSDRDRHTFLATPPVDVVEVVGAGDAFAAGYLSAMLRGLPSQERLALGHAIAARALTTTHDYSRKAILND